ncbi:MAG: DUF1800 family protein [Pseudomonadota bacterium]
MYALSVIRGVLLSSTLLICACSGGGGGEATTPGLPPIGGSTGGSSGSGGGATETPAAPSEKEASRFLTQSTFGATDASIQVLQEVGYENWITEEYSKPIVSHLDRVQSRYIAEDEDFGNINSLHFDSFWESAVFGDDQLRQRAVFALSQIMVISKEPRAIGKLAPASVPDYMDTLQEHAFGNYRDLLEAVTYSYAMSQYLTYFRNEKADPETGRMPDENYAREIMQLFTIGTVELQKNGEPRLGGGGEFIELYDNEDITGLAKVFTGLSWQGGRFQVKASAEPGYKKKPLKMFDDFHSMEEKSFLGTTIAAGTGGEESIRIALDALFNHDNAPPFISKQLIQRFVTANPSPEYVERVANVFESGTFTGPGGTIYGSGQRGDLKAIWAAILLDTEARDVSRTSDPSFGKIREPVIRFAHWARNLVPIENAPRSSSSMRNADQTSNLNQQAFHSPSVFNFYRPGYVASGYPSAAQNLVNPEMQITFESSLVGYFDLMQDQIARTAREDGYNPDYSGVIGMAHDPDLLINHFDRLLTNSVLQDDTRARIKAAIETTPLEIGADNEQSSRAERVKTALLWFVASPEFMVQK